MSSSLAFRNVGWHRNCRAPQLIHQPKLLAGREALSQSINNLHQVHRLLPSHQIPITTRHSKSLLPLTTCTCHLHSAGRYQKPKMMRTVNQMQPLVRLVAHLAQSRIGRKLALKILQHIQRFQKSVDCRFRRIIRRHDPLRPRLPCRNPPRHQDDPLKNPLGKSTRILSLRRRFH
jgi:hypothetical protein